MKKLIAATVAGGLLVAGQALATEAVSARISDRVGAVSAEGDDAFGIPTSVLVATAVVVIVTAVIASDDDSDSD